MDNAMAGTMLFVFLTVGLCALLFWDRIGRQLWYDLSDSLVQLARWLRTRRWAEAFGALRHGYVSGGPVAVEAPPTPAPVVRLPRDYVEAAPVPPRSEAVPAGTGTGTEAEPDVEPLDRKQRDAAAAEALGQLMALGVVAEADRVKAMEALFGPRGRRWMVAKPIIEQAVRDAAPPVVTPLAGRPVPPGVKFDAD